MSDGGGRAARRPLDADQQRRLEESLTLMPRAVRDKLDCVGIKLHLAEWQQLTLEERAWLRDQPCAGASERESYRLGLENLVRTRCGKAPDRL